MDIHLLAATEPNMKAAEQKMSEALRVGKCPWCCDGVTELYVFEQMNPIGYYDSNGVLQRIIAYPQETFEETQKRWFEEGTITQKEYDKAMSI